MFPERCEELGHHASLGRKAEGLKEGGGQQKSPDMSANFKGKSQDL